MKIRYNDRYYVSRDLPSNVGYDAAERRDFTVPASLCHVDYVGLPRSDRAAATGGRIRRRSFVGVLATE